MTRKRFGRAAAFALAQIGPDADAVPASLRRSKDSNEYCRYYSALALAQLGSRATLAVPH